MRRKRRGLPLLIVIASGVLGLGFATDAESAAISAGPNGTQLSHMSPEWPFVGVVDAYGPDGVDVSSPSVTTVLHGVRYRSSIDGTVTELDLGSSDDILFCGGGEMYAGPLGAWFSYRGDRLDYVDVYVPWGDMAYPMYTRSLLADNWSLWQPTTTAGGSVIEVAYVDYGWISVTIDGEERYYRTGSAERYEDDVDPSEFVPPPEPPPEWETGVLVNTSGSDGTHYGISFFSYDVTCGGPENHVFSVDSGELVACGSGFMGPIFVAPRAVLDSAPSPSFPSLSFWGDYGGECGGAFPMDELRQRTPRAVAQSAESRRQDLG